MSTFITRVGEGGNQVDLPLNELQYYSVGTIERVDPCRCESCVLSIVKNPQRLNFPLCTGPFSVGDEFSSSLFLPTDTEVKTPAEFASITTSGDVVKTFYFLCGIQLRNI